MSEPKLISPMLDNFNMGDPISDRDGVRCCPAMEKITDARYIVKIISVPANPSKLEALLLSGAYSDRESALSYYSMLADDIMGEAKLLEKLAQLDGFIPFDGCQIEPMEDGNGFDVYLLSSYGTTLQKRMRNGTLTHLEAINLGLDLCAALTVARRSGYLYADLKPGNIFITTERGYRIGDLGFLKLDGLKYASLPERYRSQYTAPEVTDAYSALNTTLDIYAAGLILYQVFNNGSLPFTSDSAPAEEFPAPIFADYEMAEIILKACHPDPEQRWQDPVTMGKALVDYMQRNGAHDTPITPVAPGEETEEVSASEDITEEEPVGAFEATEAEEVPSQTEAEATDAPPDDESRPEEQPESAEEPEVTEESIYTEDEEGNLTFISDSSEDETLPGEDEDAAVEYTEVSEDVSDMLQQVDELIAHPAPEPVVQPEPVDIPIPPPIELPKEEEVPEEEADEATETEESDSEESELQQPAEEEESAEIPNEEEEYEDDDESSQRTGTVGRWIRNIFLVLLGLALLAGGLFFYQHYYLQPIDAILLEESNDGALTVSLTTDMDESKLTVICSDTYGNKLLSPVQNGKATFTGLAPNSAYTVKVVVDGFHRLTGDTSAAYTTPVQTNIVQMTAVTGADEGSIILSFAIDGPDATQWCVSYTADDGTLRESSFAGHTVTLNGFTVGNTYTFNLTSMDGQTITGTTEVSYTASKVVKAEKLMITGCIDNVLSVAWSAPEGSTVENWTIRCYSDSGFDETKVTTETTASFQITDTAASYTVEVTAGGMSVSERAYAAANSMSVTSFQVDQTDPNALVLSWDTTQGVPQGGWKLLYTVAGSATQELACPENNAIITPAIPGVDYQFTLQPADGSGVLGGFQSYRTNAPADFAAFGLTVQDLEFLMVNRPSYSGWDRWDLSKSDYRTEFVSGENASFLVRNHGERESSDENVVALFVIRDESGALLDAGTTAQSWNDMWSGKYCALDIPSTPQNPGNYTVEIYFNGTLAANIGFYVISG